MKKPKKRSGTLGHGGFHRGLVARHAGDQRGARHAVPVEFGRPGARQFRRIFGRQYPAGCLGYLLGRLARLRTQCGEELA